MQMPMPEESEEVLELWCPFSGSIQPHLVIRTEDQIIAWCRDCFMVQVFPIEPEDDG